MTDRDDEIADRQAANIDEFMEHGPGLRRSTRTWVVARDRSAGKVLLGGLGGLGVGQMWVNDDGRYEDDETYADAPEQTYVDELAAMRELIEGDYQLEPRSTISFTTSNAVFLDNTMREADLLRRREQESIDELYRMVYGEDEDE